MHVLFWDVCIVTFLIFFSHFSVPLFVFFKLISQSVLSIRIMKILFLRKILWYNSMNIFRRNKHLWFSSWILIFCCCFLNKITYRPKFISIFSAVFLVIFEIIFIQLDLWSIWTIFMFGVWDKERNYLFQYC